MDPALSLVRPDSLHHIFYLSGRMRARALQLTSRLDGIDNGCEVQTYDYSSHDHSLGV